MFVWQGRVCGWNSDGKNLKKHMKWRCENSSLITTAFIFVFPSFFRSCFSVSRQISSKIKNVWVLCTHPHFSLQAFNDKKKCATSQNFIQWFFLSLACLAAVIHSSRVFFIDDEFMVETMLFANTRFFLFMNFFSLFFFFFFFFRWEARMI